MAGSGRLVRTGVVGSFCCFVFFFFENFNNFICKNIFVNILITLIINSSSQCLQ